MEKWLNRWLGGNEYMIFNFTFHDNGGRVIGLFNCAADWYDEAYSKAEAEAKKQVVSGIQYCDAKGRPKDVYCLPHLVRYMRPQMMMPHGVPNNWELARTDCCVEQFGDLGALLRNKATGEYAIYDGRSIYRINQLFAQWAVNDEKKGF